MGNQFANWCRTGKKFSDIISGLIKIKDIHGRWRSYTADIRKYGLRGSSAGLPLDQVILGTELCGSIEALGVLPDECFWCRGWPGSDVGRFPPPTVPLWMARCRCCVAGEASGWWDCACDCCCCGCSVDSSSSSTFTVCGWGWPATMNTDTTPLVWKVEQASVAVTVIGDDPSSSSSSKGKFFPSMLGIPGGLHARFSSVRSSLPRPGLEMLADRYVTISVLCISISPSTPRRRMRLRRGNCLKMAALKVPEIAEYTIGFTQLAA